MIKHFTPLQIKEFERKKWKWLSPIRKYQKVDFEMDKPLQHIFLHASRSLVCILFIAVAFKSAKELLF